MMNSIAIFCGSALGSDPLYAQIAEKVGQTLAARHQTLVYGLAPEARSRLNALLFTVVFIGMASGAALGSLALAHWGWNGVVALSTLAGAASLAVRFASRHLKN